MPHNRYLPTDLSANSALRLFALPYAGGGSAPYYRWRRVFEERIELVPVNLPGREGRISEPAIADMVVLVSEIADALEPVIDRPFALLGHSMGALIAFELARELRRRGGRAPTLLIVAASPAPHRPRSAQPMHALPDAEFLAEMGRRFDGIPAAVREQDELLKLLLPAMRADIELLEAYHYHDEPSLDCDILALGGTDDRAVSMTDLAEWRRHTSGRFSQRMFPGEHFFLFTSGERERPGTSPALRMIAEQLQRHLEP